MTMKRFVTCFSLLATAILAPACSGAATLNGGFGVAASGIIYSSGGWVSDWQSMLAGIKDAGATTLNIPVDQGGDLTRLLPVIQAAHALGFAGIHIAPHNDAGGSDTTNWPEVDFAGYSAWFARVCQACRNADGSTYVTSMELWNEAEYNVAGDYWTPATTLYQKAPALVASIKQYLPGVKVVVPIALDQSLEKANDMQGYAAILAAIRCLGADALSAHIYPTNNPENGNTTLAQRFPYAVTLGALLKLPIVVTEYGEGSSGSPVSAFYVAVAAWVRSIGSWGTAWQWDNGGNGDGLVLKSSPSILSSMGGTTYTQGLGQGAQ